MSLINPETGRKVSITSKKGKEVYKKYYKNIMTGGSDCKDKIESTFDDTYEGDHQAMCDGKIFKWKKGKKKGTEYECYYKPWKFNRFSNTGHGKCTRIKKKERGHLYYAQSMAYKHPTPGQERKVEWIDSYEGELWGNKKHGHGVMEYDRFRVDDKDAQRVYWDSGGPCHHYSKHGVKDNSNKCEIQYEGYWENDLRHGKGVMEWRNGKYDGYWKNDKQHGVGIYFNDQKNGFIKDKMDDKHKRAWQTGTIDQKGLWQDDTHIGMYTGDINKEGVPHGTGELIYNDRNLGVYHGNFDNYEIVGQGTLTKQNSIFSGPWKNGKITGRGKHTTSFGIDGKEIYDGPFKSNKYHGKKGKYTYLDGSQYYGSWVNGQKNGQGILKFSDNNKYVGLWNNDEFHGKGTFHLGDNKNVYTYKGYLSGTWTNGWLKQGDWHVRPLGKWLVLKHIDTNITFAIDPHYTEDEIDKVYRFTCLDYLGCSDGDKLDLSDYFSIKPSSYKLGYEEQLLKLNPPPNGSKDIVILGLGPTKLKWEMELSSKVRALNSTLDYLYGYDYVAWKHGRL